MKSHSLRLKPGEDIAESLDEFARRQHLQAACVLTCVGSLRKAVLRYANQEEACVLQGHFEIVSLTGILSEHGSHYHIAIADEQGRTIGAHLLPGSEVYTTAEIVLLSLDEVRFLRTYDTLTGYPELDIQPLPPDAAHT